MKTKRNSELANFIPAEARAMKRALKGRDPNNLTDDEWYAVLAQAVAKEWAGPGAADMDQMLSAASAIHALYMADGTRPE